MNHVPPVPIHAEPSSFLAHGDRTINRRKIMEALYPLGVSVGVIEAALNELPGEKFWPDDVHAWAGTLRLHRPEPIVPEVVYHGIRISGFLSERWTEDRVRVLLSALPTYRKFADIMIDLNGIPGPELTMTHVSSFAFTHCRHVARPADLLKVLKHQAAEERDDAADAPTSPPAPAIVVKPPARVSLGEGHENSLRIVPSDRVKAIERLTSIRVLSPAKTCQTVTDPGQFGVGIEFCGKRSEPGKSYCEACCRIYYVYRAEASRWTTDRTLP